MVQAIVTTQWLLDGFRYDLGSTRSPQTLAYYCGHVQRFLSWAEAAGVPKEAHLISKRHILSFFNHLLEETEISIGNNGLLRKVHCTRESLWPYYRSLKRFFSWCVDEGYLNQGSNREVAWLDITMNSGNSGGPIVLIGEEP